MFGRGMRLQILLPGSIRKQKRRQKNGGGKMSGSYIFAPIFLPFPVQGGVQYFSALSAPKNPREYA
jgi:hypothetical protein